MSLIDIAIPTRVFRRGDLFFIQQRFFQDVARGLGGTFVQKDEWQQIVFLCSDSIFFGFWVEIKNKLEHQVIGIDLEDISMIPGLEQLWALRNIGQTWDSLKAQFMGSAGRDDFPSLGTKYSGPN